MVKNCQTKFFKKVPNCVLSIKKIHYKYKVTDQLKVKEWERYTIQTLFKRKLERLYKTK